MSNPSGTTGESGQATIVSFYSYTGGIGRTMAIANVSWIMAAAAKKILIIDWSTESPALSSYLEPFLTDDSLFLDPGLARFFELAELEIPSLRRMERSHYDPPDYAVVLRRYGLPHGSGQIDVISGNDPHATTSGRPRNDVGQGRESPSESQLRQLREALRDSGYDYVLIDCPSGPAELNIGCAARLPDVIAAFFRMSRVPIQTAAKQVRILLERTERFDDLLVVPVPSGVDVQRTDRIQANQVLVSQEFAGADRKGASLSVEIPYVAEYAHDEMLAALADEPGEPGTLLACYEMLTSKVTDGAITAAQPIGKKARERYRRAHSITGDQHAERMFVAYTPGDRRWADWIRYQLERVGVHVQRLPDPLTDLTGANASAIVVVASDGLAGSPVFGAVREWLHLRSQDPSRGTLDVIVAKIDGASLAEPLAGLPVIDLRHNSESVARSTLLSHFGLVAGASDSTTSFSLEPRFPLQRHRGPDASGRATIVNLRGRNESFVGREQAVEDLRDQLNLNPANDMQVLNGAAGAGKSELAKEYAYRFLADYDVVWWIPADTRTAVVASLVELAQRLGIRPSGDPATTVLRELASGNEFGSCLLIYDNANDLDQIRSLLPRSGSCHVLITSRTSGAGDRATLEVGPFSRQNSMDLLRTYVPGLTDEDARLVADVAGDLPLALQMAGAWLRESAARLQDIGSTVMEAESLAWSAAEFAQRVRDKIEAGTGTSGALANAAIAAACTEVCLEALGEANLGRVAKRLVEVCSFMASDGVALRLVYSGEMVTRLTEGLGRQGESVRAETVLLDQVCWTLSRYGLAELRRGHRPNLRLHHLTQQIVRLSLSGQDHASRQADALASLAAFAPPDAEEDAPEHNATYAELHRHLVPSGALDSTEPAVRRWVVNEIRYLYRRYHVEMWEAARALAEQTLRLGSANPAPSDELGLRLRVQLANIYRALGRFGMAQQLDEEVLHQQRKTLTQLHPRTLMTARSHGGDLRGLGRFDEALAEDLSTVAGLRAVFGPDHAATLMALHNLALSWFLNGDADTALSAAREVFERRLRLFGEDDRATWRAACQVGDFLREVGRAEESRNIVWDAHLRLSELDRESTEFMAVEKSLGITYRKINRLADAIRMTASALELYTATHGADHPDTLSCRLAQASNLFRDGQATAAADEARECLSGYVRGFQPDHPFGYICRSNLGLFMREAGDVAGAVEMTGAGLDGLRARLTPWHPWVIAACVNHAASLIAAGEVQQARQLDKLAYEESREALPADHPCAEAARHNRHDDQVVAADADVIDRRVVEIDIPPT